MEPKSDGCTSFNFSAFKRRSFIADNLKKKSKQGLPMETGGHDSKKS